MCIDFRRSWLSPDSTVIDGQGVEILQVESDK